MLLIRNDNTDPYFNLALEEYLLKEFNEDCFILWQNEPCVVVGKNQNVLNEINENFIRKNNIKVARRISGGGAVYHDLGNLNFTYIINDTENDIRNYEKFLTPIIEALATQGVNAEMSERNDLTINGLKFSGNAQYKHKNRLLHHGTILFSSNLNNVRAALKTNGVKSSRGVQSIPSPITNVKDYLEKPANIQELKITIINQISKRHKTFEPYVLTEDEKRKVIKLVKEKYSTNKWIDLDCLFLV